MAVNSTVRILAALSMLTALGVYQRALAAPARQDSATVIEVAGNRTELQNYYAVTPPSGFSTVAFTAAKWLPADGSPCAQPTWTLPPGATGWLWNPLNCSFPWSSLVLRRSFVVPAGKALTARLWFAVHGTGHAWLNGKEVGQSAGQPTLVDVTHLLKLNGTPNVLAFDAVAGIDGGGIAYDLRLTLSTGQFNAFRRTHPTYDIPEVPATLAPVAATTPVAGGTSGTTQATGTCLTTTPSSIVSVLFGRPTQVRLSTGWVYGNNQNYVPNQPFVYVVTRLVDLPSITQVSDMPTVVVGNQSFRAVAIGEDAASGDQILVLPPDASAVLTPLDLTIAATHNQPIGDTVNLTADSRSLGCLASYQPHVLGYPKQISKQPIGLLDSVPSNDAADGAVAQDSANNFLGTVDFELNDLGSQVPYLIPYTIMQPDLDALVTALAGVQPATSTQLLVKLTNLGTGNPQISYTNVTPTTGGASSAPTAVTSVTPGAGSTPGAATPAATPTTGR